MGKTKTVFVGDAAGEKKSGHDIYEEKRKKKTAAAKAQLAHVGLKGGERIKVVGGDEIPEEAAVTPLQEKAGEKKSKARVRGKKYKTSYAKIDRSKLYKLADALKLVRNTSFSKFDGTVELHLIVKKIGLSANVNLPHPFGHEKKVEIASDETIEKLKKGKIDFDVLLATPDMMPKLVAFAKVLGPKGLMPNPKTGTLIKDAKDAKKFSGNSVTIKTEKDQPVIHIAVGKLSQKDDEITKNIEVISNALDQKQILKIYIKSTMSPSVKVAVS